MSLILEEKRQLRKERVTLTGLINRYGDITLLDAHDRVSVELDYYRGDCRSHKKRRSGNK